MSSKCSAADRLTVCDLTKQAVMLEAKNEEKNKIIMMLADELIYLAERAKWDRQCVIAQGLNSIPSTRFAPDFNCTTVEKYLNGRNVKSVQDGNVSEFSGIRVVREGKRFKKKYIYNGKLKKEIVFHHFCRT